jgi:hypothetical protein
MYARSADHQHTNFIRPAIVSGACILDLLHRTKWIMSSLAELRWWQHQTSAAGRRVCLLVRHAAVGHWHVGRVCPRARVTAAERQGAIRLVSVTSSSARPLGATVQWQGGTVRPGKHDSRTER